MEDYSIFKFVTILFLCLLALVTTVINTACICIISKTKSLLRRPSTYFILNLLSVHLVQGLVVFPFYAAKKAKVQSRFWDGIICNGFRFSYMITFYAAVWGVLLITLDRVLATWYVMRYKELVTKRNARYCIIFFWLYIISLCLIPFFDHKESSSNIDLRKSNISNVTVEKPKSKCNYKQSELWTILMLVLNCMLPYFVIVVSYWIIRNQIHKFEKRERSMSISQSDQEEKHCSMLSKSQEPIKSDTFKRTKQITLTAKILSIAYFLLWSPSVIYFILWSICPSTCFTKGYKDSKAETYIGFTTKYLAFLDAIAAPLIYCLYHEEFRKLIPFFKRRQRLRMSSMGSN